MLLIILKKCKTFSIKPLFLLKIAILETILKVMKAGPYINVSAKANILHNII